MIRNYIIKTMLLGVLILSTSSAWAITCTLNYGVETRTLNFPSSTIFVPMDTPHGKVIATGSTGPWDNGSKLWGCTTAWTQYWRMQLFDSNSEINGVYRTNLKGIGIRITDVTNNIVAGDTKAMAANQYLTLQNEGIKAELVRINGTLETGSLNIGLILNGQIPNYEGVNGVVVADVNLGSTVKIYTTSCNADTSGLFFPIGDIPKNSFGSSVGYIPPSAKNTQNLSINCDGVANATIELQATQNPDVASDKTVIAVDGQGRTGVAKGVGVQILYNGQTPLQINTPLSVKELTNGTQSLPLVARYYQTKSTVTTGLANATFTLNVTYQ